MSPPDAMTASTVSRPDIVVGVAGTATEVGKTWVTERLIRALRSRGRSVAARKPVQSFDEAASEPTDAEILAAATGEHAHVVCPETRWYPRPMAPPMAAAALGLSPPMLDQLVAELRWPDRADFGFVESVGGVRSPIADDADSRDLLGRIAPEVVILVADAGLGTIDAVRLAVEALGPCEVVVFLNRFDAADDLHARNRGWLTERDRFTVEIAIEELVTRLCS